MSDKLREALKKFAKTLHLWSATSRGDIQLEIFHNVEEAFKPVEAALGAPVAEAAPPVNLRAITSHLIAIAADISRRKYVSNLDGVRTVKQAQMIVANDSDAHGRLAYDLKEIADELHKLDTAPPATKPAPAEQPATPASMADKPWNKVDVSVLPCESHYDCGECYSEFSKALAMAAYKRGRREGLDEAIGAVAEWANRTHRAADQILVELRALRNYSTYLQR